MPSKIAPPSAMVGVVRLARSACVQSQRPMAITTATTRVRVTLNWMSARRVMAIFARTGVRPGWSKDKGWTRGSAPTVRRAHVFGLRMLPVKPPLRQSILSQLLPRQHRTLHRDRHRVLAQEVVVELSIGHFSRVHQFLVQLADLQRAEHIARLVERTIIAGERAAHFGRGVVAFVADAVDQVIDALLRRPFAEVE